MNWRGRVLESREVVVNLIAGTTRRAKLFGEAGWLKAPGMISTVCLVGVYPNLTSDRAPEQCQIRPLTRID
jgi:hypothetical protein